MKPRASFAGAAIEVSDLKRSVAFHRLWLPTLGFHRVWTSPDRLLWASMASVLLSAPVPPPASPSRSAG